MISIALLLTLILSFYAGYTFSYIPYKNPPSPYSNYVPVSVLVGEQPTTLTSKENGDRFEEHVVRLIHPFIKANPEWVFTDWRGDKYLKDICFGAQNNRLPDLEFLNRVTGQKIGVECKWWGNWFQTFNGAPKIDFAEDWKLQAYNRYKQEKNMKVYAAIGVGWNEERNAPNEFYVINLEYIRLTFLTKAHLVNQGVSLNAFFGVFARSEMVTEEVVAS